jgi:serine phosphatase RsbU (regulator of sigma subunit)
MQKLIFLTFLYISSLGHLYANDSLLAVLKKASPDSSKIKILLELSEYFQGSNYRKSLNYAKEAESLAIQIKHTRYEANALYAKGYAYTDLGIMDSAFMNYKRSAEIYKSINSQIGIANTSNDLAYIFQSQGNDEKALEMYFGSLKSFQKLKDKQSISICLNNIGLIYLSQKNYQKALAFFNKSLKIKKELRYQTGIAMTLNNIGTTYLESGANKSALVYFEESLEIRKKIGTKSGIAQSYENIGTVYRNQKKFKEALKFYEYSFALFDSIKNEDGIISSINSIATIQRLIGNYKKAAELSEIALEKAKKIGSPNLIKNCAEALTIEYQFLKNYELAFENLKLFNLMNDSLNNLKNAQKIAQISFQYELDQFLKQKEVEGLKKELKFEQQMGIQKNISYFLLTGLLSLIVIFILAYRSLQLKKRANIEIQNQKLEIEIKSNKLQKALTDITDSIKYAKRLQDAFLLNENDIKKDYIKNIFLFFKPKDIVSGDFYWFDKKENAIYIAAADCTGHGVPGAFLSMLCYNLLKHALNEYNCTEPSEILQNVNINLNLSLQQNKDNYIKDGMDIALIKIENKKLYFAGANNPIYIISNHQLIELTANKKPIGKFSDQIDSFKQQIYDLNEGDLIYLFSDGYADQFGGPKMKKLKHTTLQKLLLENHKKPMDEQKIILQDQFNWWKGSYEQIDDVLIIGIKYNGNN